MRDFGRILGSLELMIFHSFKGRGLTRLAPLPLVFAIAALLVCAHPVAAETTGGEISGQVSAAATSAPEGSIVPEQPQVATTPPAPEPPVEAEGTTPVDPTGAAPAAAPAAESSPTVPASSDPPVSTRLSTSAESAGSRPSVVADPAPPAGVSVPSRVEPDETIVSPGKRRLSGLAESAHGAHRDLTKTITAATGQSSSVVRIPFSPRLTNGISPLPVPRLETPELELPTPGLDSIAPALALTLLPHMATGPDGFGGAASPDSFGGAASEEAPGFSGPSPAGLFSRQPSLFPGVHSIGSSVDVGSMRLEAPSAGGVWEKRQSPTQGRVESAFSGGYLGTTGIDHLSSLRPAPSPLPLPAPESPGSIGGGSGGSFFVPLVALLALLALVASATLRRRLEVADFPLLTQFVCALERPG
jgi:hypothetical protein